MAFVSGLREVDGVLLYAHEQLVYECDGWGIIDDNGRLYTSHKDCTDEEHKYGYPSSPHEEPSEVCQFCDGVMPGGIWALLSMYMCSQEVT